MFGHNLKRLRLKCHLTQAQVAESAQIHKRYYQDLEACLKIPSVVIAARLQKTFRCEWSDLTKGILEK